MDSKSKLTTQTKGPVAKTMKIGEAVGNFPEAAKIMTEYGLHCIGCHVSPYETIEQGAMAHGMPDKEIDKMIAEINKTKKKSKKKPAKKSVKKISKKVSKKKPRKQ